MSFFGLSEKKKEKLTSRNKNSKFLSFPLSFPQNIK